MTRKALTARRKPGLEPTVGRPKQGVARPSAGRAPNRSANGRNAAAPKARLRDEFRSFARASILSAAEEVLAVEGLHSARIEEIAQRARVAVGTIYNLVGDRDALVREILQLRYAEILEVLATAVRDHAGRPFREQLHALIFAVFQYFGQHWRFFQLVLESERSPAGRLGDAKRGAPMKSVELRKLYGELMQRGIDEGAIRRAGSDLYPAILSGMMREVMIQDLERQVRASAQERADVLTRMFLEGAGAP